MLTLDVKSLNIFTHKKVLVHNVNLSLEPEKTLALMGASGSGKSLTAMALANALTPNVFFKAKYIKAKTKPALIMQNPSDCFDPLFRIEQSLNIKNDNKKHSMLKLFEEVGLTQCHSIASSYPFELSGGMLHKIMIAIAIAQVQSGESSYIIADEPVSGLDSSARVKNLNLLKSLQKKYGFALLYIDHKLKHVKFMGDSIAIMHEGKIVEYGNINHVLQDPKHAYTKKLMNSCAIELPEFSEDKSHGACILSCHNLQKTYSKQLNPALSNISFELMSKQSLGIIGSNGAGKSTLMRAILALEKLDGGKVQIMGQEQNLHKQAWRKNIQAVFQHARLAVNPRLKCHDILLEPLLAHGFKPNQHSLINEQIQSAQDMVEELLKLVKLPSNYAKAYPVQMSGGQLQRLCIARALALKPKILILDEPLSDLDAVVAEDITFMLEDLKKKLGITLIYIAHDLHSILRLCERVLVLEQGKLVDDFLRHQYNLTIRHKVFKQLLHDSFYDKSMV